MSIGLFGLMVLALFTGEAWAERRVALVIGNANYENINRLGNPANDAPDITAALRKVGFEVILRTELGKGGFDRALSEFARKAVGSDAALFYYAGHGIQYQKQNYMLPIDIEVADYNDVEFQAVSVNRAMAALERTNGVKILILDACRDNPLDRRLSAGTRGMMGATRGLARIDRTEGAVIAYATASDAVAQDGSGRNSPFTEALIRRLNEPGLEIATLFRRVTQDVYERTGGRQRPEISISLLNDFYFNSERSDALAWTRIRDSAEQRDFQEFVQTYPSSPFAEQAQSRIDIFEKIRRQNAARLAREQEQQRQQEEANTKRERAEAQRQDAARQESARQEVTRQEAARREEAERLQTQQRADAERAEAARVAALRKEVESFALRRAESARAANEKREAERLASEQVAALKTEEHGDPDRRQAALLAIQRRIEAEPVSKSDKSDSLKSAALSEVRLKADLASEERREAEQSAADEKELGRLLAKLSTARPEEVPLLNKAIRDLDRRAVERLAAKKRREATR